MPSFGMHATLHFDSINNSITKGCKLYFSNRLNVGRLIKMKITSPVFKCYVDFYKNEMLENLVKLVFSYPVAMVTMVYINGFGYG